MSETFPCEGGCGNICRNFPARKTRLCVHCSRVANGRHPNKITLSRAKMKARMADPAIKAETLRRAHDGWRKRLAEDPEFRARVSENGRRLGKSNRGHDAQPKGSEPRRRAAASRLKTLLGWCPPEYLDEYRRLVYSKRVKAADARRMIEEMVAAESLKLTPFERQLQRIRAGEATVIAKFKPSADTGPYTLGGVATGML